MMVRENWNSIYRGVTITIKKLFFIFIILSVALSVACVSAEDNSTVSNETVMLAAEEVILEDSPTETLQVNETIDNSSADDSPQEDVAVVLSSEDTNIVNGKYFTLKVSDDNGNAISNKSVYIKINGVTTKLNTSSKGIAKLMINQTDGSYTVKCTFKEPGYVKTVMSTKILVISTTKSNLVAKDYTAYYKFKNQFVATLTVGDLPLANRNVKFTVNKKNYVIKTNSKGKAYLPVGLAVGTYKVKYSYAGEKNIKASSGSAKITVKKMSVVFKKANSLIYREKTPAVFKVKLSDQRGDVLSNKNVKIVLNKKTYTKKTDKNGVVSIKINLKKGSYDIKYTFSKTSLYQKSTKTFNIHVKSNAVKNNGIWLWSSDMDGVNLNYFKKIGMKHIFLNAKAIEKYGKTHVEEFIKEAKDNGIKTHLWMQVFYKSGKWQYPVKNGKLKYDLINSKVKEAISYAKVKGVAGVHFDYLRFPGNAYNYKNAVKAVNYFTKKASAAVHKVNSKLIVSAAVMPEPSSLKTYYAQDIPTISKYLDVIVPMVYKGNYHAGSNWIKSVTHSFVKMSKKAQIWTGLQSYASDSDTTKLSAKTLISDSDYAGFGGAKGVILFRNGLLNYFNFSEV